MPEDGYNGKDIIEIGKDLAQKHPKLKITLTMTV